ncbi:MAG TPA: hypothetical protein VFT57_14210 [Gemmatimonadaceae bacterium]|nr:hypothetical protein [Gemmatimonadaceae bacterium]
MLRRFLLAVLALALTSGAAHAQNFRRPDTLGDSTRVAAFSFRELFRGMKLTKQEEARAKQVILDAFKTVMTLPEPGGCPKFEHWKAVVAKRDSILLTLVHSQADSVEFRKRAAPQGPKGPCPYTHGS